MSITCLPVSKLKTLTKNEILPQKNMSTFFDNSFLGYYKNNNI